MALVCGDEFVDALTVVRAQNVRRLVLRQRDPDSHRRAAGRPTGGKPLLRSDYRDAATQMQVEVVTLETMDREIARLEAEQGINPADRHQPGAGRLQL